MLLTLSSHWRFLWLVTASLIAGVMNALAGGGSFLSFPALLGMGVPPIEANATNTVALWPGQLTSVFTLWGDVPRQILPVVLMTSIGGGILGAEVLLHTPQRTFLHLVPWLLLTGALIFGVSGKISRWVRGRSVHQEDGSHLESTRSKAVLFVALVPICFYIGYFGAGAGLLIMTVLSLMGMENMHQLNAMKVVAACASNLAAILTFVLSGRVLWHYCLVSMLFAAGGGYIGARYARRMNPEVLRAVVVISGVVIAGYFFWRER